MPRNHANIIHNLLRRVDESIKMVLTRRKKICIKDSAPFRLESLDSWISDIFVITVRLALSLRVILFSRIRVTFPRGIPRHTPYLTQCFYGLINRTLLLLPEFYAFFASKKTSKQRTDPSAFNWIYFLIMSFWIYKLTNNDPPNSRHATSRVWHSDCRIFHALQWLLWVRLT